MFKNLINRVYTLKIGTRTALSFFAVVFVALFFSVSAILLLQYGKKIDTKISNGFSPVINAIRDYQYTIEETQRLTVDIHQQYDANKALRLKKILDNLYNRNKLTVIGLCHEKDLSGIRTSIIEVDSLFQLIRLKERKILEVAENRSLIESEKEYYSGLLKNIEDEVVSIRFKLGETSLQAIGVFKKMETQKYASYRTLTYTLLLMILVIIVVSILSVYLTNITVIKPIKELSHLLSEVGEGKIISFSSKIKRQDEIGHMINTTQQVVQSFRQKALVANAIGKGNYKIKLPLLSKNDRLGKALIEMRDNLDNAQTTLEKNLKELEAYALNLEKKNKELDQFAYITSHDLKSPLRGINNLAEWIMEDMGDQMTPESLQYFKLLRGRVHRMEGLINSILKFSRAGKSAGEKEWVDVKSLVIQILDQLKPPARFKIFFDSTLPSIYGNRKDIYEVFLNFISNAINHNNVAEPVVNINYRIHDKEIIFCIADNGPGIDPTFHQKIFTIFQTLEARDKEENIGAGLAIVKKIIESYGGTTWLTSTPNNGAKFYFSWPVVNNEKINYLTQKETSNI